MATTHNPIPETFHLVFPHDTRDEPARVCFVINKRLDSTTWKAIDYTRDIYTLTIKYSETEEEGYKEIAIHNVYNLVQRTENRRSSLPVLQKALQEHQHSEQMILGDFNLYHEYWGGSEPRRAE